MDELHFSDEIWAIQLLRTPDKNHAGWDKNSRFTAFVSIFIVALCALQVLRWASGKKKKKENLSTSSYLFADQKASCYSQPVGEIVNAIGQKVQVSTGLSYREGGNTNDKLKSNSHLAIYLSVRNNQNIDLRKQQNEMVLVHFKSFSLFFPLIAPPHLDFHCFSMQILGLGAFPRLSMVFVHEWLLFTELRTRLCLWKTGKKPKKPKTSIYAVLSTLLLYIYAISAALHQGIVAASANVWAFDLIPTNAHRASAGVFRQLAQVN